jgi:hypothetical protein
MELENENNPAVDTAQELSPKPEAEATVEQSDDASQEETETGETEDQAELAEEFEDWTDPETGKVHKIAKDLKPKLLMQADYTRKAQEVAEQRRQIEAAREEYEREVEFREATWQETAALTTLEQRLANFQNTDWRRWHQANPQEAQAAQAEYMALQGEHSRLSNIVQAKRYHIASQREQQAASRTRPSAGMENSTGHDLLNSRSLSRSTLAFPQRNKPEQRGKLDGCRWLTQPRSVWNSWRKASKPQNPAFRRADLSRPLRLARPAPQSLTRTSCRPKNG